MELYLQIIQFLFYSTLIVMVSKYLLIPNLRNIAKLLKLSSKKVGNIAGIATSIPELLTVSFSAFTGLIATSTYNIITSNTVNLFQYALSVILNKNQKKLKNKAIRIDLSLVYFTILIPILMITFNIENNLIIIPFFIILSFLFYRITNNAHKLYITKDKYNKEEYKLEEKKEKNRSKNNSISIEKYSKKSIWKIIIQFLILIVIGIILYVIGNRLSNILDQLCRRFNVSEFILGVLLGIITSIPELITFFESQKYHTKEEGIIEATGNLLTSNIMNLFIIQSIGIIIFYIFK